MQGFIRAIARLLAMAFVMAAVVVASVFAGVAMTTAIAIGIVFAGVVGLLGVARRPHKLTAAEEIDAMMAPKPEPAPVVMPSAHRTVDPMAPPDSGASDPEANMPRWRRPSLLEARHSDPTRQAPTYRLPMRFAEDHPVDADLRIVRYAVVPVLDRPDEVLGQRVADLESGDEIQAIGASGAFVEVVCPNGDRGWVHRTTLGQRNSVSLAPAHQPANQEADDALTALLSARGLI
jgi:hypothetical protein